ncbi:hypothetical protein J7T55_011402 [Diaporthe amygdali]|uniref:uncharacterized protein n=1 Tax=Phomopsis amygdali TaxID=1214568 RepID=UPI0022FF0941|nr:uncharacterized protein J7T55_011402 [Diaporthe amygdali]KAJ0122941.1 hypothetical protein J7T55_011402 [Diaporthe amygdali]
MPPRAPSSVYAFGAGYRPGQFDRFLDQVDMGIDMGGLVRFNEEEIKAERTEQYRVHARLRLNLDTAELDLKDFINDHKELKNKGEELQGNYSRQTKLVEDAYALRDVSTAMGLELVKKNLRIELSVCIRELDQKAMALKLIIDEIQKRIAMIELNIIRAEQRLHELEMKLRPVSNIMEAMNP